MYVMLPNATKHAIKSDKNILIKFDFVTGDQEIKIFIHSGGFLSFLVVTLPFQFISLCVYRSRRCFFSPILR